MARRNRVTLDQLRQLEPLSTLSTARLEELVPLTDIVELGIGHSLFREGDVDNQTIYLLDGDVQMASADGKLDMVFSHSMLEARFPLDDSQPRQISCTALSKVKVARIDNSILEYMIMWDQLAVSEQAQQKSVQSGLEQKIETTPKEDKLIPLPENVTELRENKATPIPAKPKTEAKIADGDDRGWIRKIRQVMAFKNLPPANIKSLLERMETVQIKAGEQVIKQGEPGDFYYVLTDGKARVTRMVELAQLEGGASFGEEALLSGGTRNASVTMLSDGSLMRLAKKDFDELLKEPMLHRAAYDEAQHLANTGARWLDVRYAREHHHSRLPGSINIPLHELRTRLDELKKDEHYICYCGTGRRSSAAAFLLAQHGYRATVLTGGVQVIPQLLERADLNATSSRRPGHGTASQ
ncbi:MAG: cyclic nucleotide-binding domain-containing protein [Gammaproteobacteria bacterium]|nr:cyclic nucleotide-binding domain-containing protein [Gammaproteobacteria bacterium]MDH5778073.1 cyclic nucleotide-binding domain-containing protein [Gammaproteobacteria bacterium]